MNLFDRNLCVRNRRLDNLLLNDRLHGFMQVMVDVLLADSVLTGLLLKCGTLLSRARKLVFTCLDLSSDGTIIFVKDLLSLFGGLVVMDFRLCLTVLEGLDHRFIVVLVLLFVDNFLNLLLMCPGDMLLGDRCRNRLISGRVIYTFLNVSFCGLGRGCSGSAVIGGGFSGSVVIGGDLFFATGNESVTAPPLVITR